MRKLLINSNIYLSLSLTLSHYRTNKSNNLDTVLVMKSVPWLTKVTISWTVCGWSDFNSLSANSTKWSNTLTTIRWQKPTRCLSVFDHFVGLALKRLMSISTVIPTTIRYFSELKLSYTILSLQHFSEHSRYG